MSALETGNIGRLFQRVVSRPYNFIIQVFGPVHVYVGILNDNIVQIARTCLFWLDFLDDLISCHLSSLLTISKMEGVLVFLERSLRNCQWTSRNRTKKKLLHMAIRLIYMSKKTGTCFKPRHAPWKPATKDGLMLPVHMPPSLALQLECCRAVILFCRRTRIRYSLVHVNMVGSVGFCAECLGTLKLFCQRTGRANALMLPSSLRACTTLPSEGLGAMELIR